MDTNSYQLTINGQAINYYGNQFTISVDLHEGYNVITVKALDHKGLLGENQVSN